jgi:uncharacterized protein YdaU (DUF1376 family)
MSKAPAFQFYANDWLSSMTITMMSPEQEGAYVRLLAHDWSNDGIPDDDKALAALSRLGEGWFKGGSTVVRKCFNQHPTKEGFLTNPRLQSERDKQAEWREKSRLGGIKSAKSRAKGKSKGGSEMVATKSQPKVNSSTSSSSSKYTPTPKRGLTKTEKKIHKVKANTQLMERIGQWFNRKPDTLWTIAEQETLDTIAPSASEVEAMERRYKSGNPYLRQDLMTLLNNWSGELDKASSTKSTQPELSSLKDGTMVGDKMVIGGKLKPVKG